MAQQTLLQRQAEKRLTRFNYRQGPMYFLGQQIVRQMQDAGYPAVIHSCLRSAEDQMKAYRRGVSKAKPFQSPHQYYLAVDIIHEDWAWFAAHPNGERGPEAKQFWAALAACAENVEAKFGVKLDGGWRWDWDAAHIELDDWRTLARRIGQQHPTQDQLDIWFAEVLPDAWKQFQRSKRGERVNAGRIEAPRWKFGRLSDLFAWLTRRG